MASARMFTIVVASGTSQRYGSNKLLEKIGDETVLERSVRVALDSSDGVVVVTDPNTYSNPDVYCVVAGGQTRSESVRKGLEQVPKDVEIIAVHDGARPCATKELYLAGKKIIEQGNVAAVPAVLVTDTIKKIENETIATTLDRSALRAVQTPQVFNAQTLRSAHQDRAIDTDDAALVEALGAQVVLFEGQTSNRKVTKREDLVFLRALLQGSNSNMTFPKIGYGYDIHPFGEDENKKLVLGGVSIDHRALVGHSDADALSHALTDALLSAIGAPDLGTLFPASDPSNKDASSLEFLQKASELVAEQGYVLSNASLVINAQEPKLASHIQDMKSNLIKSLDLVMSPASGLSITAKHGEGIGEIGQGQAICVYATVLIVKAAN